MKMNEMNLWINGNKHGGPVQYTNHSCNPNWFEQFACAGQMIVMDILRKKERRGEKVRSE